MGQDRRGSMAAFALYFVPEALAVNIRNFKSNGKILVKIAPFWMKMCFSGLIFPLESLFLGAFWNLRSFCGYF